MDIKLLKKFAANKCSPDEVDAVFNWVQEQPDKITGENLLKSYWKELEVTELPNNETALWRLYKIHHTINLNQSERLTENKIRSLLTKKFSPVRLLYRAAAILLIPVITLSIKRRITL